MSKANRAFVRNEEAVSPVIGVILMVAITVVLAAVVFVLVSNLGKSSNSAPTFALSRDDATDRLSVTSADSDADWNRLAIKGPAQQDAAVGPPVVAGVHLHFGLNAAATDASGDCGTDAAPASPMPADCVLSSNTEITGAADLMSAGEYLEFCNDSDGAAAGTNTAATGVTFTIVDTTANQVIGTFTFNDIAGC
jgi:flagellin-like protein